MCLGGNCLKIIYVAGCVSQGAYARLYGRPDARPVFQAQKYNRLFVEGLSAHTQVEVVGYPPADVGAMENGVIDLPDETVEQVRYHYIRTYRRPLRRWLHVGASSFFKCLRLLDKDSVVMIDCLNQMSGLGALLASKVRGCRCVGVITDLPEFLGGGLTMALSEFLIRHSTDYVVLTKAMNDYVNRKEKPYVVLEGHADITMEKQVPSLDKKGKKRICLYAGSIHKLYGIQRLVEGFLLANIADAQLHIYGIGDYQQELEEIAAREPSIHYGGLLLPSQVVEKEMEATLLLNPRPSDEKYVAYSFPSKTMEYMSTGTPVLTTALPCLPEEYKPYLYFIREETPQGIGDALRQTLSHSDEELFERGCQARRFVLEQRNNVVQAAKVLAMLEGDGKA